MTPFAEKLLSGNAAETISITNAAKKTGVSRDTIFRLYKAGFIKGAMPGPKKILLEMESLRTFLAESAQPGFWTPERRAQYSGAC